MSIAAPTTPTTPQKGQRTRKVLCAAVMAGAVTACAVAAAAAVMLFRARADAMRCDPWTAPQMQVMRSRVAANPTDAEAIEAVRKLDAELRATFFTAQRRMTQGRWVLLAAIGVASACAGAAAFLRRKLPRPTKSPWDAAAADRLAAMGRASLAVVLALLVGTSIGFILASPIASPPPSTNSTIASTIKLTGAAASADSQPVAASRPAGPTNEEIARNWPRFRGPNGDGVGAGATPAEWDGESKTNVLWAAPLPLPGKNSPIVWGEKIFLTGADDAHRAIFCFDTESGKLLWRREILSAAGSPQNPKLDAATGFAPSTAATDGRVVCAIWPTGDVAGVDLSGKLLWNRNLGLPADMYGHANSLAIHGDLLLVQYDQKPADDGRGRSLLLGLDVFTGQTRWQRPRPVRDSWSSPVVVQTPAGKQLITTAEPFTIAYDPASGRELWRAETVTGDVASSPIFAGGLVMVLSPNNTLFAIRPDGSGVVTETHVKWKSGDGVPEYLSPTADAERFYMLTESGLLTCIRLADGATLWEADFNGKFDASPSLAGGKLYATSTLGKTFVLDLAQADFAKSAEGEPPVVDPAKSVLIRRPADGRFIVAAITVNRLSAEGESFHASAAFGTGRIYIRGSKNLYAIGAK